MSDAPPLPAVRHRFRPAHPATAAVTAVLGGGLLVSGLLAGGGAAVLVLGGMALALGGLYFASPAWRTEVRVSGDGLEVVSRGERRFRLGWGDVVRVVAAPASRTAFVDGGEPSRSLLLPGPGARAPYRIENQAELFQTVVSHVAPERIVEVARLGRELPAPEAEAVLPGPPGPGEPLDGASDSTSDSAVSSADSESESESGSPSKSHSPPP